eukprot:3045535-Rhodomonas_salina.1
MNVINGGIPSMNVTAAVHISSASINGSTDPIYRSSASINSSSVFIYGTRAQTDANLRRQGAPRGEGLPSGVSWACAPARIRRELRAWRGPGATIRACQDRQTCRGSEKRVCVVIAQAGMRMRATPTGTGTGTKD